MFCSTARDLSSQAWASAMFFESRANVAARKGVRQSVAGAAATAARALARTFSEVFVVTVNGTATFSQRMTTLALSVETSGTSNESHSRKSAASGLAFTRSASWAVAYQNEATSLA